MNESIRLAALPFAARLLVVGEFLLALHGKIFAWDGQAAFMSANGIRFVAPLLGAALAIELLGSICLITGLYARAAATVLFLYLGIVSVELHPFWSQAGDLARANEGEFFKNLGMMAALLMIAGYGPGPWALGRRRPIARKETGVT
jgi:putative oxidoreductase